MKFDSMREKAQAKWQKIFSGGPPVILVGTATCGQAAGAGEIIAAIKKELKKKNIKATLIEVGCIGLCYLEPLVDIIKPGAPRICYSKMTPALAAELVADYLAGDNARPDLALGVFSDQPYRGIGRFWDLPMLKNQVRLILANCGHIDPTQIDHYIARDGYRALSQALTMNAPAVVEQVTQAGLRGRGGGGFPTGKKWQICREAKAEKKYLICNADEGDPGAFMNRSLLESDPHLVLEGMLIAAYAIGAAQGYIYIRAEYPLAIKRLERALGQMAEYGLLGKNILGSEFSFDISIKPGAGAFVCGEETALIASLEGRRGMPRSRPPYPAVAGLGGMPTVINNVGTLAAVSVIMAKGAQQYRRYGTESSRGTKTFALAGKVKHTGLIEVPLGITVRDIVYDIGGGTSGDKKFKAVQTGGPSGGCLNEKFLDSPVDYDSLKAAGSIMGSGGMIVMDEGTCPVDIAAYFLSFTQAESCGKCAP
jgi:NADH-quinone oxidoreductase subunit F